MTIEQLVETLNKGQHTLVLFDSQGQLHTFNNRGVKDLYQLLTQQPEVLKGALVADKVVGKGAAALMAAGGVARLHTHTVSKPAKELLGKAGIDFAFDVEVDHIENRAIGRAHV